MNILGNVFGDDDQGSTPIIPTIGSDPFTLVYNALWVMIEADPVFTVMVKPGNRIKYATLTDREPEKREHSTADVPQVILQQENLGGNLHADSNGTRVSVTYTFTINSGQLAIGVANTLQFQLLKVLSRWKEVLAALTWEGQRFVHDTNLTSGVLGRSNPANNNNIRGQTAIWSCSVGMIFSTQALKA